MQSKHIGKHETNKHGIAGENRYKCHGIRKKRNRIGLFPKKCDTFVDLVMKKGWTIIEQGKEELLIRFSNGEVLTVRADGRSGYGFVKDYLRMMGTHYKGQLQAADALLERMLGLQYKRVKKLPNVYQSYLAVVSLGCAFGGRDGLPHCSEEGELHFTYADCPLRPVCPYNGYAPTHTRQGPFGCRPIYETGLTPKQTEIAVLLISTPHELADLARMIHLTEGRLRNIASEIYTAMGVGNRHELTLLLKGKRLV